MKCSIPGSTGAVGKESPKKISSKQGVFRIRTKEGARRERGKEQLKVSRRLCRFSSSPEKRYILCVGPQRAVGKNNQDQRGGEERKAAEN